ncbi:MAG: enoyl-CoA hydratase-related protein [Dehalococcoidales bacterium]|nr:enoyl-CoA hydratase-related protein [Dehalococcoidales bacterium]
MNYQTILVEKEKGVGTITLNRPERRNALSTQLVEEVLQALHELDEDSGIGAVIIRGAGTSFCAGHDFSELVEKNVVGLCSTFRKSLHLVENIAALSKPVIAAVHGYATAMGCALAVGCDMVIAAEDALFQLPGTNLGAACISPAAVVCRSLGRKKCVELLLTADPMSAEQAEKAGLVNRVVPVQELDAAARELAEKLASKAPLAVQMAKEAIYNILDMDQSKAYDYAAKMISINFDTEDGREGAASFLEKRKPRPWKGR